jgi:D-3-phosphoglycerate dehydrogenase
MAKKPKVFVSSRSFGQYDPGPLRRLQEVAEVVLNPHGRSPLRDELIAALADADGLLAGHDPVDAGILDAAPGLKIVARHGVGIDRIDVPEATRRKVLITTTPGANARAVAEFVFALMLGLLRRIPDACASMRAGGWDPRSFMGRTLCGKTLGIVGFGAIGRLVARMARGFEMKVIAHDPFIKSTGDAGVKLVNLDALLAGSDVVTLHCALTGDTRQLIGADAIAKMKPASVLINTARSGVVDSRALLRALQESRIAGAALDVFDAEPPPPDDPLRTAPNLLPTPHIAAYAEEAVAEMDRMCSDDLIAFFTGKRPRHALNPEVLE